MTYVTCRLTAKNWIGSGNLRSAIEYGLPLPFLHWVVQCEMVLQVCKLTECFCVLANVLSVIVTCFCHDCGVVMNHVWNVDAND